METHFKNTVSSDQSQISMTITFDLSELHIKETPFGSIVELNECKISGEIGGPGLPAKVIRVALPVNKEISEVSCKPLKTKKMTDKPILIAPVQPPRIAVANEAHKIRRSLLRRKEQQYLSRFSSPKLELPRADLYKKEKDLHTPLCRLIRFDESGPNPVAFIQIHPVFIDENGLLDLCTEIEVIIYYREKPVPTRAISVGEGANPAIPIKSLGQAKRAFQLAQMQVANPELVWDLRAVFSSAIAHVDYLIITDNCAWEWDEGKGQPVSKPLNGDLVSIFQQLADWKERKGLRSRVVSVSEIVDGSLGVDFKTGARDLQEIIRNFLKWAHENWGISWVLLGGDVSVIPVRYVAAWGCGDVTLQNEDPIPDVPKDNFFQVAYSFWEGSFLKMKLKEDWCCNCCNLLVRPDTGLLIPYDKDSSSNQSKPGWYFTVDDTYSERSEDPTQFIRVNGSDADLKNNLRWIYSDNSIPTDLYYASLVSPNYSLQGKHDWDLLDNGIYGQYCYNGGIEVDLDGVSCHADVSVGRAPVSSEQEAKAFKSKVIAYEQFRSPDGKLLDLNWPRKMLFGSTDWGSIVEIIKSSSSAIGDNKYYHESGRAYSLIKLEVVADDIRSELITFNGPNADIIPFDMDASFTKRGWYYAKSLGDLFPNCSDFNDPITGETKKLPLPSDALVVYGGADDLSPDKYVFAPIEDVSMRDQEILRNQIRTDFPEIDNIFRLYQDYEDLTPAEIAAAPIEYITRDAMQNRLRSGMHLVSLSGHGGYEGCCAIDPDMAGALDNGYHTFIAYADSCLTNKFDEEDSVSEKLLYNPKGGAVGYIGNTRFSWCGGGDEYQRAFFNQLCSTNHLGLLNDSRCNLESHWIVFSLNLVGDPEMVVWIGAPESMNVELLRPETAQSTFKLIVSHKAGSSNPSGSNATIPVEGAAVHIRSGDISSTAYTDPSGTANFNIGLPPSGIVQITATKPGFIPFMYSGKVADCDMHGSWPPFGGDSGN